jgi:ribosomal protein S7
MRARKREISEKYKSLRLRKDSLYDSRLIQTFFNKFTKKGKKALAKRHLFNALGVYRRSFLHPALFFVLIRLFYRLRIQFIIVLKRKARKIENVPVPVRRNKRDVISLQTLYKAISTRRERTLPERVQLELNALTFYPRQSPTMRAQNAHLISVYDARVNMEER